MTNEAAERYARGLFELARENQTVEAKKEECEGLLKVLQDSDDFLLFLKAVKVTAEEKKNMICTVFKDTLDQDMIHFLELLVDKDRIYYLKEMLQRFIGIAEEYMGIRHAFVDSARKLSAEDMHRIRTALEKKYGSKITLENRVDPKVIAGIKVTVGNNVTDVTMKSRISDMKEKLLKGGLA
ncbi:MAG: F0F1 ATP synthase subunit delta [Erysipelotrichia bacterium]|nr:F0F1 ATP synthase subunit delta [Erysipelotrichia bacterium]